MGKKSRKEGEDGGFLSFTIDGSGGGDFGGKKEDRQSRKTKGKMKDFKRRSNRLNSIERDYLNNLVTEPGEAEGSFGMVLSAEDLLKSLDELNFVTVDSDNENEINEAELANLKKTRRKAAKETPITIDTDLYDVVSFNQLNRDLKLFLKDEDEELFECAPAPGFVRKYIHLLGNLYRLKTFSVGSGEEKRTIIQKTESTGLPANPRNLDSILLQGNKAVKWSAGEDIKSKGKKGKAKNNKNHSGVTPSAKPAPGSVVGHGSGPIEESNIGNLMLKKMGWQPGTGLGRESDGIKEPIAAVVKAKRAGLA